MNIEITILEIIIIFALVLIYYLFKSALNLAIYKKASQELSKVAQEIQTVTNQKSEKKK